ncbi:orotidine 5'-phosphate decarboxylase / HUMPS family protein [Salinifilum ghardaiensis]
MQLQVALDRIALDEAVRIAGATAPHADWVEVGTSLIKRYGMRSVSEVSAAAGEVPVLADLKTADDAATEFTMAFDHGARAATVLGAAADATLDRCTEVAEQAGAQVVVDLLAVHGARRVELLDRLPGHVVFAAHLGKDVQGGGAAAAEALGTWARHRRVALAGGLRRADLPGLRGYPDLRVIVGSAITRDADPAARAREFTAAMGGVS